MQYFHNDNYIEPATCQTEDDQAYLGKLVFNLSVLSSFTCVRILSVWLIKTSQAENDVSECFAVNGVNSFAHSYRIVFDNNQLAAYGMVLNGISLFLGKHIL